MGFSSSFLNSKNKIKKKEAQANRKSTIE